MRANLIAWIALHKREMVFTAILFITATLSFGFGYLADRTFNHAPIIIEACANHP